jgi:hypothetical protein
MFPLLWECEDPLPAAMPCRALPLQTLVHGTQLNPFHKPPVPRNLVPEHSSIADRDAKSILLTILPVAKDQGWCPRC